MDTTQAACKDRHPDIFFPATTMKRATKERANDPYAPARRICHGCPVRVDCLEEAIAFEGSDGAYRRFGMFGGLSPYEREQLHRSRRRAG